MRNIDSKIDSDRDSKIDFDINFNTYFNTDSFYSIINQLYIKYMNSTKIVSTKISTTIALSAIAFSTTLLAGCISTDKLTDKAVEKATEKATEVALEKVADETGLDVDISEGSTTITKDDGTSVSIGGSVQVPSNWPSDVPFPDDVSIVTAGFYDGSFNTVFNSPETPDTIAAFYEDELTSNGWTNDTESILAGYYNYEYSNGDRTLNMLIVQNDEQTITTLSVTE